MADETTPAPRAEASSSDTPRSGGQGGQGGQGGGPGGPGGPRPPRPGGGGGRKFFRPYRDVRLLQQFVAERGKITPRRLTGVCTTHQRRLTRAIKQARNIALLPFAARY
jgi:small subunit ribosomal protein S18